jgi:hypothetical protein
MNVASSFGIDAAGLALRTRGRRHELEHALVVRDDGLAAVKLDQGALLRHTVDRAAADEMRRLLAIILQRDAA